MAVQNVTELEVYKKAYQQAMNFFEISSLFPPEERYALTSQGRRSSRSVPMSLERFTIQMSYDPPRPAATPPMEGTGKASDCMIPSLGGVPERRGGFPKYNTTFQSLSVLREAWAKRRYAAHFVSKLTDCDGENSETETSLDFARDCGYISPDKHSGMTALNHEIGKMLGAMIKNPEKFLLTPDARPLTPKL